MSILDNEGHDPSGLGNRHTTLYSVISDIREQSGLGARPMLDELAGEIGKMRAERARLREENEALRRFLQIALDEHDDHFGKTDAEQYPRNWDVQARKRLAEN